MRIELEVKGLDLVIGFMVKAGDDWDEDFIIAAQKAMNYLWGQVPEYPEKPQPGTASQYWTDKQRRWFFYNLHNVQGFEPVYKRTGLLGRSLLTERGGEVGALGHVATAGDRIIIVFGTAIPYAELVIGPDNKQAPIHQGRWWQLEDVAEEAAPGVAAIYEEAVDAWLARYGMA